MKPTGIVKQLHVMGKNNIPTYIFVCDDGQSYSAEQLAGVWEIGTSTLYRWLRTRNLEDVKPGRPSKKKRGKTQKKDKHVDKVNSFIPSAERFANKVAQRETDEWTNVYCKKMNELTTKAGLRCGASF